MGRLPISAVWPLQDGVLQIIFETGSTAVVNLRPKFETARFCPLREESVWKNVKTDGNFVRWYRDGIPIVEMACEEVLGMIVGSYY